MSLPPRLGCREVVSSSSGEAERPEGTVLLLTVALLTAVLGSVGNVNEVVVPPVNESPIVPPQTEGDVA